MNKRSRDSWEWDQTDDISEANARKRRNRQTQQQEARNHGFDCNHCRNWVTINDAMGTHNRNHCPHCLWSKHVDDTTPGDRKSDCQQGMHPIALTFRGESADKYATRDSQLLGELMLVHECVRGDIIRINRIAADDNQEALLEVFETSYYLPEETKLELVQHRIFIATQDLAAVVMQQLFGGEQPG